MLYAGCLDAVIFKGAIMKETCGACHGPLEDTPLESIPNLFRCKECECYNRLPKRQHADTIGFLATCNPSEDEIIKTLEKFKVLVADIAHWYFPPRGKSWDIACGLGGLVKSMQDVGFEATGNDIRPEVVKEGNRIYGIEMQHGHFEHLMIEKESIDVITCFHGIEHTLAPYTVMVKALEVLKPGGLIYLAHPDIVKHEYANKYCDKSGSIGGHSYEWTHKSFEKFIEQFPELSIMHSVSGSPNLDSNVPPTQEWLLKKMYGVQGGVP